MTSKKFIPQKLGYFSDAVAIFAVDFPIYYIESISERHIVIAGGGGSSKTGVHNQINILELIPTGESCTVELVTKYQIPDEIPGAIMTGALMKNLPIVETRLVTGGSQVTIYHINFDRNRNRFFVADYEQLKDSRINAEIKSIKYTPGRVFLGGMDGQLSVWNVGKSPKRVEKLFNAHTKEIDEIDVDLVSQQVVTLSRSEERLLIWNLADFKLVKEFKKDVINKSGGGDNDKTSYNYRSCRYAYDTVSKGNHETFLLVACNSIPVKGPSKIYKWSTRDFRHSNCQSITMGGIMAMTVSLDGSYVAIGTSSGGVSIFEVKNLSQIYKIDGAHYNVVTKLEFLPSKQESLHLTNSQLCPLLSVSVDRRVILHRPKRGSVLTRSFKLIVVVLVCIYLFFSLHNCYFINTN